MGDVKVQQVVRIEKKLGRLELLNWLNELLRTDYAKVQDCADGIAYCQLLDSLAPGLVPLHKLTFSARTLDDNIKNLRILEEAMYKLGVRKDLDVAGIAKGKFQENNEFLQWLHALLQKNAFVPPDVYKAFERRWAAQERQKKAQAGSGSRPKGRPHQLNSNLVPNEYEWHEGPVRESASPSKAAPPSKPTGQNPPRPPRSDADSANRGNSTGLEGTGSDHPGTSRGPVGEAPAVAAPGKRRASRASGDGGVELSGRVPPRGSDEWGGENERVSWIDEKLDRGTEAWLGDPLLEDLGRSERRASGKGGVDLSDRLPPRGSDDWGGVNELGDLSAAGKRASEHEERFSENGGPRTSGRESGNVGASGQSRGWRETRDQGDESRKESYREGGSETAGGRGGGHGDASDVNKVGGPHTSRQQAELESLIAYLESELVSRLRALADAKKEVKVVDEERRFYYDKLRRIEKLCEHAYSVDAVTPTVLTVVDVLSNEDDCPAAIGPSQAQSTA